MSACSARREQLARAPEAGRDLVQHQQHPVLVAQLAQQRDALRRVEAHPARALHDRLDDHAGELVCVLEQRATSRLPLRRPTRGSGAKTCSASVPFHIECIPPSGSQTAIAPNVSPW